MKIELTESIKISRPYDQVFTYVSTLKNHKFIFNNIDSRQETPGPVGIGTKMTNVAKVLGHTIEEHFVITQLNRIN